MENSEKWKNVLDKLSKEMSAISFDLWIKPIEMLAKEDDTLVLNAGSSVAKNQVQKHFLQDLQKFVQEEFGSGTQIKMLNPDETSEFLKLNEADNQVEYKTFVDQENCAEFNPKYTFENFVVGPSNRFVFVACKTIAEHPSERFNPLFIYGGVGLGKTHLLHAIGNYIKRNLPQLKIVYITCENLCNDYVEAIKSNSNDEHSITYFREKYRNVDVLMVDDIQFISKKVGLQEEVFHTFNDLFLSKKQIIFSSDRPPQELSTLDERLKSRFNSGLTQDVQSPDFETRLAILKKKASLENYEIQDEALNYIAEKVDTNIREMEGYLSKVIFYASLNNEDVATLQDAELALENFGESTTEVLDADKIIDEVTKYFNLTKDDVLGKRKTKEISSARQICVYLMTELLDIPLTKIGDILGGRDHTTIMHSRDKIAKEYNEKPNIKTAINDLKTLLKDNA